MFDYDRISIDLSSALYNRKGTQPTNNQAPKEAFAAGELDGAAQGGLHINVGSREDRKESPCAGGSDCDSSSSRTSGYVTPSAGHTTPMTTSPSSFESMVFSRTDEEFLRELSSLHLSCSPSYELESHVEQCDAKSSMMLNPWMHNEASVLAPAEVPTRKIDLRRMSEPLPVQRPPVALQAETTSLAVHTSQAEQDGFSNEEIAQFTALLENPRTAPPIHYQCHICYKFGHYINDCPERFNQLYAELTPYQGRKKCYGEFQCQQCKRRWTSLNSVANEAQSCIKCHIAIFPHKQLSMCKAAALGLIHALEQSAANWRH